MNFIFIFVVFCLGIVLVILIFDYSLEVQWIKWKVMYNRLYGMNEEGWRRVVWEKNMKMIELYNQEYREGKYSFIMVMNVFGDMISEEFRQVMNGF